MIATILRFIAPTILPVALVAWAMLAGPLSVVEDLIDRF